MPTSVWALAAEAPRKPLTSTSKDVQDTYHRTDFIANILFGIARDVKLPANGFPGVGSHARTLGLSEETVRKIEELIWEGEIRDQNSEFVRHAISCRINLESKHWLRPGMTWWQRCRVRVRYIFV
jgi:hypothetical protein